MICIFVIFIIPYFGFKGSDSANFLVIVYRTFYCSKMKDCDSFSVQNIVCGYMYLS